MRRRLERGAALITVLMIVAAMSAVALGLTRAVTAATDRARALDTQAQLRLYATAAEEVAKAKVGEIVTRLEGKLTLATPGFDQPLVFPLEDGSIGVRLRDASNCFNLNSLVQGAERQGLDSAMQTYRDLLTATPLDRSQASALVAAVVDWMDGNSDSGVGGAESAYYEAEAVAYRTSGQPLVDLGELKAIRGYDAATLALVSPYLCARPYDAGNTPFNLNTIGPEQAPLLIEAFRGALTRVEAERLIESRPATGWADVNVFLNEPEIEKVALDSRQIEKLSVVTSFVEVIVNVAYRGQVMRMTYVFKTEMGVPVQTIRRERVG